MPTPEEIAAAAKLRDDTNAMLLEIGAEGLKGDSKMQALLKGVRDELTTGFSRISAMLEPMAKADKGADKPPPKGADDDKPADDKGDKDKDDDTEDTGADDNADDDGEPGYSMRKGVLTAWIEKFVPAAQRTLAFEELAKASTTTSDLIDGTEVLINVHAETQALRKAITEQGAVLTSMLAEQAAQSAAQVQLRGDLGHIGNAVLTTLVPLTKGMQDVHGALATTPAGASRQSVLNDNLAAIAAARKAAKTDGPAFTKSHLMLAMSKGVIDGSAISRYNQFGLFDGDEAENAKIVAKVTALKAA